MKRKISGTAKWTTKVALKPLKDALRTELLLATFETDNVIFSKAFKAYAASH